MNIGDAKNILGRKFRGANLDDVQGISNYTVFEEAAVNLLSHLDPMETIRHSEINLYNDVFDYAAPSDLKGKKVIDPRPQGERNSSEDFRQDFIEDFDRDKEWTNNRISVEFDEGTKFLRINKSVSNSIDVTTVESEDWTAGTGVSSIAEDTDLYHDGGKSLRFNVSSGSNLLTWAGTAKDLDDHELRSRLFLWVYWPDSSIITSITLRIGSDASNYYEITGAIWFGSVRDGWNLYSFNWNGATETGSVDEANVDYARLAIVTTAADTDVRIGELSSKLPSPHEIVYYSEALFRPSSGATWKTIPTVDTDVINLDIDAQNIFIHECCLVIAEDLQRDDEAEKFRGKLGKRKDGTLTGGGDYGNYKKDKPSEAIRPQSRYYTAPRTSRRGFTIR